MCTGHQKEVPCTLLGQTAQERIGAATRTHVPINNGVPATVKNSYEFQFNCNLRGRSEH